MIAVHFIDVIKAGISETQVISLQKKKKYRAGEQ